MARGAAAPGGADRPLRPSRVVARRGRTRAGRARASRPCASANAARPPARASPAAAKAYLDAQGGALSEAARGALAAQVAAVMEAPELAPLFGPGSRGEVSLAGVLRRTGRPDLPYSGRLDRMLVNDDAVTIADFKLGAAPARPRRRMSPSLPSIAQRCSRFTLRCRCAPRSSISTGRRCARSPMRKLDASLETSGLTSPRRGLFCQLAYSVTKGSRAP